MEDGKVDEGVGSHEEVGEESCHGLEVANQDAADGDEKHLLWLHNVHDYTMVMITQCSWLHNVHDYTMVMITQWSRLHNVHDYIIK